MLSLEDQSSRRRSRAGYVTTPTSLYRFVMFPTRCCSLPLSLQRYHPNHLPHHQFENDRFHAVIETKESHEFVGIVTIRDDNAKNRDGDLALNLTKSQWGKGYGQEVLKFVVDYAFKGLGCHRLSLGVFDSNERAIKLYKRV